jgi:hypothetical protein
MSGASRKKKLLLWGKRRGHLPPAPGAATFDEQGEFEQPPS